jgi:uncharacterized coiled-coil protein SlyX
LNAANRTLAEQDKTIAELSNRLTEQRERLVKQQRLLDAGVGLPVGVDTGKWNQE